MVLAKKKQANAGLGRALISSRFGTEGKSRHKRVEDGDGERFLHTSLTAEDQKPWAKIRSITQQTTIEEFLSDAQLANKAFTSDRTLRLLREGEEGRGEHDRDHDENDLDDDKEEGSADRSEREFRRIMAEYPEQLMIPRPPPYDPNLRPAELQERTRKAFLGWRRHLASLEEAALRSSSTLTITPFEKNVEIWKQLWRVLDMSDLVVNIVDARDPEFCRVKELESLCTGRVMVLINKADYLTLEQRQAWAEYLKRDMGGENRFIYFSAVDAAKAGTGKVSGDSGQKGDKEEEHGGGTQDSDVLNVDQLIARLEREVARVGPKTDREYITVGLVGYPNVGKSSTINAILGRKKVAVAATPGRTKHTQTIPLSSDFILCDCPGLVFPRFTSTSAEMVCQGMVSIDELRDIYSPMRYLLARIPYQALERVYGFKIRACYRPDGEEREPNMEEILNALATARGYMRAGNGLPDHHRVGRMLLKDYVTGKLLWVKPPPGHGDKPFRQLFSATRPDPTIDITCTSTTGTGTSSTKDTVRASLKHSSGLRSPVVLSGNQPASRPTRGHNRDNATGVRDVEEDIARQIANIRLRGRLPVASSSSSSVSKPHESDDFSSSLSTTQSALESSSSPAVGSPVAYFKGRRTNGSFHFVPSAHLATSDRAAQDNLATIGRAGFCDAMGNRLGAGVAGMGVKARSKKHYKGRKGVVR